MQFRDVVTRAGPSGPEDSAARGQHRESRTFRPKQHENTTRAVRPGSRHRAAPSSASTAASRRRPTTRRAGARLKADGDANRIMLLLPARASREMAKAIEVSAESFAKAIGANTKAIGANTEALKRLEGKIGSKTNA